MSRNTRRVGMGLILLVGAALRIALFVQLADTPFFDHPLLDAEIYDQRARAIAAGSLVDEQAHFYSPLYPYVLGAAYAVTGPSSVTPRLLNLLFDLVTTVALYRIGRRCGDRRAGLLAALFWALYLPSIFYSGLAIMASLVTMLTTLLAAVLVDAWYGKRQRPVWWIATGLLLGLAVLARANAGILLPLFLVVLWMRYRPQGVRLTACLLAGLAVCIGLSLVHNVAAEGEWLPVTSSLGLNFYVGNNPDADGTWSGLPGGELSDFRGEHYARNAMGRELSSGELSSFYLDRGLQFAGEHPGRVAGLVGRKAVLLWRFYEVPHIYDLFLMRAHVPVLGLPLVGFGIVSPLALVALILAWVRGNAAQRLLSAFALLYLASLLPFFVAGRLRVPLVPVLIVLAAQLVTVLWDWLRAKQWTPAAAVAAIVVVAVLVVPGFSRPQPPNEVPQFRDQLAQLYGLAGDAAAARATLEATIEDFPAYGPAYTNLAALYVNDGDLVEAARLYELALDRSKRTAGRLYNLAVTYASLERLDEAIALCEEIAAADPEYAPAYSTLTVLYMRLGRFADAVKAFRNYTARAELPPPARARVLSALIANDELQSAGELIEEGLAANPGDPWLRAHRAELLLAEGDRAGALLALRQALAIDPELPIAGPIMDRLQQ